MTCQERRDLMLLYVTGALEPDETTALRDHLLTACPTCAGALAEAEATLHAIPQSLPPVPLPAAAWNKIEQRIALKDQTPTTSRPTTTSIWTARTLITMIASAAALIIICFLLLQASELAASNKIASEQITKLIQQRDQFRADSQRADQLQTRLTNLERQIQDLNASNSQLQLALDQTKSNMDRHLVSLMDSDQFPLKPMAQPDTHAKIFANKSAKKWMLCAGNLQSLPAGKTYELWIIPDGKPPIPAGTFTPDTSGMAMHETKVPDDLGPLATAAVTIEPEGGRNTPTMPIQFAGAIHQN